MEGTYTAHIHSGEYLPDEYGLGNTYPFEFDDSHVVKTGLAALTKDARSPSHSLQHSPELESHAFDRPDEDEIVQSSSSPSMEEPLQLDDSSTAAPACGEAASVPMKIAAEEHNDQNLLREILNRNSVQLGSEVVSQPFNYVCSLGSKGVREKFIDALNVWMEAPEESVGSVKQVSQMLHNSSLLLDDFQDSSNLRRGKPAAHTVFGAPQTVNTSSYFIVEAIREVLFSFGADCLDQFIGRLIALFVGQSFDLHWTYNSVCPSISEYTAMIDNKTGTLFTLLTDLMSSRASYKVPDLHTLATLTGRYFQIRDDYQNLMSADYTDQKGFCEDLDEGKYSLPLIHLLLKEPDNLIVRNMLSTRRTQGHLSLEQKMIVLEEFKTAGSLAFTRTVLQDLHRDIGQEIQSLEAAFGKRNPRLRALWELLRV